MVGLPYPASRGSSQACPVSSREWTPARVIWSLRPQTLIQTRGTRTPNGPAEFLCQLLTPDQSGQASWAWEGLCTWAQVTLDINKSVQTNSFTKETLMSHTATQINSFSLSAADTSQLSYNCSLTYINKKYVFILLLLNLRLSKLVF